MHGIEEKVIRGKIEENLGNSRKAGKSKGKAGEFKGKAWKFEEN